MPFLALYTFDWIMFLVIIISIAKHKSHWNKRGKSRKDFKSFKESFTITLSLAVVFGLGWGFGLLATSYPVEAVTITFQVIFSIFVGTQGILLFLFHGIRNSDVRHFWKNWFTSIGTTTRLSHLVSSSKKAPTTTTPGSNVSQSGTAALPQSHFHKIDLSSTEQSTGNELDTHEIGEEEKQDSSKELAARHDEEKVEQSKFTD